MEVFSEFFKAKEIQKKEETLKEFFEYLDSLTTEQYDANSLTGHGRDFISKLNQQQLN